MMKGSTAIICLILAMLLSGNAGCTVKNTNENSISSNSTIIEANRKVVNNFFVALETQRFDMLKKVFAVNGKQLNPYAPENFPKSFDGAEAIYKQNSGLTTNFGAMRFPQADFCHGRSEFLFRKI